MAVRIEHAVGKAHRSAQRQRRRVDRQPHGIHGWANRHDARIDMAVIVERDASRSRIERRDKTADRDWRDPRIVTPPSSPRLRCRRAELLSLSHNQRHRVWNEEGTNIILWIGDGVASHGCQCSQREQTNNAESAGRPGGSRA